MISLLSFFFLIAIWSVKNFFFLTSYNEPSGTDGYFYLKQILSLSRFSQFYFQDHSLAFWLPVGLNAIFKNELLAYQASIVITMSLIGLALGILGFLFSPPLKQPKNAVLKFLSLVAVFGSLFSNYFLFELGYNYLKTSVGLMFFMFGVCCFEFQTHQKKLTLALGAVLFLLSILAHKTTFVLIGLYVLVHLRWRRHYWYLSVALAAFGWGFASVLYPSGKQYLLFLVTQQIATPDQFLPWLKWLVSEKNWLCMGPFLTLLGFLSVLFLPEARAKRIAGFSFLLGFIAWNPFLVQNLDAPTYRLAIIHWGITPSILVALWVNSQSRALRYFGIILAGFVVASFKYGPSIHGFFKGYSKMDGEVQSLTEFVKQGDHLTCHHGLEFYVDFKTPIRCRSFISSQGGQKKWRLVWAPLQRGAWTRARVLLNAEAPLRLGRDYFLMPEERWVEIASDYNLRLNWRNPMEMRPSHIYE